MFQCVLVLQNTRETRTSLAKLRKYRVSLSSIKFHIFRIYFTCMFDFYSTWLKAIAIVTICIKYRINILLLRIHFSGEPMDPCSPSPCGPNSKCREVNGQAVCTCLPEYRGIPPNCRPHCVVNAECPAHLACLNKKCTDPCPNTCGLRALCTTKNHNPICTCPVGFTGDPFSLCSPGKDFINFYMDTILIMILYEDRIH